MKLDPEDPQGRPDGPSDPYHEDREGTSGESLGLAGVYTSPDGAMLHAGKLHVIVLNEEGTTIEILESVLITPAALHRFNDLLHSLKNTVLIEAHIAPLH